MTATKNSNSIIFSPDGSKLPCSTNSGKTDSKKALMFRLKKAVIELLFDFSKKEIVKYFLFTVSLLPLYF